MGSPLQKYEPIVEVRKRFDALFRHADDPPRCPRCGSYKWIYKGDRQVCADCGR